MSRNEGVEGGEQATSICFKTEDGSCRTKNRAKQRAAAPGCACISTHDIDASTLRSIGQANHVGLCW